MNRKFISLVKEIDLHKIVNTLGRLSVTFNSCRRQGKNSVGDLTIGELRLLRPFIENRIYQALIETKPLHGGPIVEQDQLGSFFKGKLIDIAKCSSKQVRLLRSDSTPIRQFKIGLDLTPGESLSWLHNVNKLSSVRHKDVILRVAHGDIYTKERLFRFGLTEEPKCPRCNEIETLEHKLIECDYVKRILNETVLTTNLLRINPIDPDELDVEILLGVKEANQAIITVHAEIINRILRLKDNQDYLIRPKVLVSLVLKHLTQCEPQLETRRLLRSLLDHS